MRREEVNTPKAAADERRKGIVIK